MGHLTYLSEEIIKLTEKCGQDLGENFQSYVFDDNWVAYVTGPLKATKERDSKPLGGGRPEFPNILAQFGGYPGDDGPNTMQLLNAENFNINAVKERDQKPVGGVRLEMPNILTQLVADDVPNKNQLLEAGEIHHSSVR